MAPVVDALLILLLLACAGGILLSAVSGRKGASVAVAVAGAWPQCS